MNNSVSENNEILPDFNLAPLLGADPRKVLPLDEKAELGRFMLGLAAAFNDLKGGAYLAEQMLKRHSLLDSSNDLRVRGQFTGMQDQVFRLITAIIHELLKLIASHKDIVKGALFDRYVSRIDRESRAAWKRVVEVALGEDKKENRGDALSQMLVKIRNKLAFHYDVKVLAKGYEKHFFGSDRNVTNERAVVSDGNNFIETRFYYVDAAYVSAIESAFGVSRDTFLKQLDSFAREVNRSLKTLIVEYLRSCDSGICRYQPESSGERR